MRTSAVLLCLAALMPLNANAQTPASDADPLLWLEDVTGDRALAWVRERNAQTVAALETEPPFAPLRERIRAVLDSRAQIPAVVRRGEYLWNFWQDGAQPRGLWRRATLAEYRKSEPKWESLLDLDALGRAEGVNWVWNGAECLGPEYRRCLLRLSRGGADAVEVREYDLVDRTFVDGGFRVPEAKSRVVWLDRDTVFVGTDFGPGSMTDSGYPRIIKRWRRGQPLAEARTVFEAERGDVAAWISVDHTPGFMRVVLSRSMDFYTRRSWLLEGDALRAVPYPEDATLSFWRDQVVIELRSDAAFGSERFARGSLLIGDAAAYLAGKPALRALFTPTPQRSLSGWTPTQGAVVVSVLDNVASRLEEWTRDGSGAWQSRTVQAPFPGTLQVSALADPLVARDPLAEDQLLRYGDFLTPDSLFLGRTGSDQRELLKSRPSFFDSRGMRAEQLFATSRDGTRVPYFVVWPKSPRSDGRNPTLLYGYGGFLVSQRPAYLSNAGVGWLERGGVFVLANIRGGGEYGPAWHQAALKEKRQNAYDDFIAVAEDLVKRGITTPAQLGIQGGSNGGLLVGVAMVQRPDLFGAVVCQVPLLDMKRYHKLLAGASWMAEYGDPDDPAQWRYISRYSPYQNLRASAKMPPVLFTTSTRDDRVHPGHARKMAEKMRSQGHQVLYYENIEGGHAGAADNAQRALMRALEYSFLWRELQPR